MKLEIFLLIEMKAKHEAEMKEIRAVQNLILAKLSGIDDSHVSDFADGLLSKRKSETDKYYAQLLKSYSAVVEKLAAAYPSVFDAQEPPASDTQRALSIEELLKAFSSS